MSQISPFNSSFATATGGYKKYAIVSDSSGNFWVSTTDSNLTTPGTDGASWQSLFNGYATEGWTGDNYVGKATGDNDYSPYQAGIQKSSGKIWLSYVNSAGTTVYVYAQPSGDYALQTALTAEVTRAEAAEETLNNDKVNRAGDTMTGALYNSGGYNVNYNQAGSDANGVWYNGFTSRPSLTSAAFSTFVHRTLTGKYDYLSLQLTNSDGSWQQLEFRPDGRLYTTGGNTFALTSELPTSGTLTGTGSVITGYWTKTAGILRQTFTIEVSPDSDGNATVTFPKAFSEVPTVQATGSVEL